MSVTGGLNAPAVEAAMSRPQWVRANVLRWLALLVRAPRRSPLLAWRTPSRRVAVGVIVAVAAIVAIMIFGDAWSIMQAKRVPLSVLQAFNEITDFGKAGWFLVPPAALLVIIAVLASPALPHMTRLVLSAISVRLAFLFFAVAVPGLMVSIVKRLIGRSRPLIDGNLDPLLFRPFGWSVQYASLPSGHATNVAAAAVALGVLWPRWRPLFWSYALVIGVSRVVVTAHHPSDVLAGAIAGALGAMLVRDWFATRRLGFVLDGQGGIRTLPGPSFARIKRVARQLAAQ